MSMDTSESTWSPMSDLPVFKNPPVKANGEWMLVGSWPGHKGKAVGIDPGVNYGATLIADHEVYVWWGKLPPNSQTGWRGIYAYDYIKKGFAGERIPAVVEGAAYYKPKGQVGLEEVRFGFFLALHHMGYDVLIMPPAAIRKLAFGGGRVMATDIWPTMNSNAADSVGCALAALRSHDANDG